MRKHRVFLILVSGLLVTWPHFSDPPMGSEDRDDPRVGSTQQSLTRIFHFFHMLMLTLRLFAALFVLSQAFFLGVVLFVSCVANSCKWQVLHIYGQTWKAKMKRTMLLLLLLLGNAARFPKKYYRASYHGSSCECEQRTNSVGNVNISQFRGEWRIEQICRSDIQNLEHSRVKRMLLVSSGSVET